MNVEESSLWKDEKGKFNESSAQTPPCRAVVSFSSLFCALLFSTFTFSFLFLFFPFSLFIYKLHESFFWGKR